MNFCGCCLSLETPSVLKTRKFNFNAIDTNIGPVTCQIWNIYVAGYYSIKIKVSHKNVILWRTLLLKKISSYIMRTKKTTTFNPYHFWDSSLDIISFFQETFFKLYPFSEKKYDFLIRSRNCKPLGSWGIKIHNSLKGFSLKSRFLSQPPDLYTSVTCLKRT